MIHRDIKPGNAIYNSAGQLVLTDFGLARDASAGQDLTSAGVLMGTPAYVAPEQAVGSKGVTKASDIYALGVILFELLCGRPPFEADTPMGVVLKHLYDEPPAPSCHPPRSAEGRGRGGAARPAQGGHRALPQRRGPGRRHRQGLG